MTTLNDIVIDPKAFRGKTIVITGILTDITRNQAQEIIEKAGGKLSETISKKTDLLIAGENGGSKLEKAKELQIKVMTEKEFVRFIDYYIEVDSNALRDQTVVITGTLIKYTREEIQALVEEAGGKVTGSVSKNTDLLVVGDKAGSKLEKATELGIKVLDEEGFIELIDNNKN
jgi:NAD-dependent DNA ligase